MAVASLPSSLRASLGSVIAACRRLLVLGIALLLSVGLAACSGEPPKPPVISAADMAVITRQAEGFLSARDRLPELADLVNNRDWTFTRNLIHGPMQEVGREMLYINQRLLPADRPEAEKLAANLKNAMAELDEAARLQDGEALRKAYIKVASGFGLYAQVLPDDVKVALKQV